MIRIIFCKQWRKHINSKTSDVFAGMSSKPVALVLRFPCSVKWRHVWKFSTVNYKPVASLWTLEANIRVSLSRHELWDKSLQLKVSYWLSEYMKSPWLLPGHGIQHVRRVGLRCESQKLSHLGSTKPARFHGIFRWPGWMKTAIQMYICPKKIHLKQVDLKWKPSISKIFLLFFMMSKLMLMLPDDNLVGQVNK